MLVGGVPPVIGPPPSQSLNFLVRTALTQASTAADTCLETSAGTATWESKKVRQQPTWRNHVCRLPGTWNWKRRICRGHVGRLCCERPVRYWQVWHEKAIIWWWLVFKSTVLPPHIQSKVQNAFCQSSLFDLTRDAWEAWSLTRRYRFLCRSQYYVILYIEILYILYWFFYYGFYILILY